MKISKPVKILVGLLLLAGAGGGGWLFLMDEEEAGAIPGKVADRKSGTRPGKAAAKAQAKALPTDPDAVIKAVIEESGSLPFLAGVSQQARESAAANSKAAQGVDVKTLEAAIERIFDPAKMTADLAASLKQNYDADRMPRFVELLRQPVAVKMNALEAQQPSREAVQQYFESQKKTPPSLDRQRLIQRVDETSRTSESAAELVVLTIRNMIQSAQAATPQASAKLSRQEIDQSMDTLRGQLSTQFRSMHHFVYRQASDVELGEYVSLLASDTGKWGTVTVDGAIRSVVEARGRELGAAIAQMVLAKPAGEDKEIAPAKPAPESRTASVSGAAEGADRTAEAKGKDQKEEKEAKEVKEVKEGKEGKEAKQAPESIADATKEKPPASPAARAAPEAVVASSRQAETRHAMVERPAISATPARPLYTRHNDLLTATVMMDHASMAELLTKGKSPNVRQRNGYTPLMISAAYGDVEGVRLLLAKGADVNARLPTGETALSVAKARSKAEVAALIESLSARN